MGQLTGSFWTSSDVLRMNEDQKVLFAYLITCDHSNTIGCYRLPLGYIMSDLNWAKERVTDTLDKLLFWQAAKYDKEHQWVFIPNYMKHNKIQNPNQALAALKQYIQVPDKFRYFPDLVTVLKQFGNHLPDCWVNSLETLSRQFSNGIEQNNIYIIINKEKNILIKEYDLLQQDMKTSSKGKIGKDKNKEKWAQAEKVIEFMNEAVREVKPRARGFSGDTQIRWVYDRLRDGASENECRAVIANRITKWGDDPKMQEYIRPKTIFNKNNFNTYLGELGRNA